MRKRQPLRGERSSVASTVVHDSQGRHSFEAQAAAAFRATAEARPCVLARLLVLPFRRASRLAHASASGRERYLPRELVDIPPGAIEPNGRPVVCRRSRARTQRSNPPAPRVRSRAARIEPRGHHPRAEAVQPACIACMFFITTASVSRISSAGLNSTTSVPGSCLTGTWPGGV